MTDPIDRQMLKADLLCGDNTEHDYCFPCKKILECIDNQPAVQPERKRGKWRHYEGYLTCPECGTEYDDDIMTHCGDDVPKFCPNCGNDNRGEQNDEQGSN